MGKILELLFSLSTVTSREGEAADSHQPSDDNDNTQGQSSFNWSSSSSFSALSPPKHKVIWFPKGKSGRAEKHLRRFSVTIMGMHKWASHITGLLRCVHAVIFSRRFLRSSLLLWALWTPAGSCLNMHHCALWLAGVSVVCGWIIKSNHWSLTLYFSFVEVEYCLQYDI